MKVAILGASGFVGTRLCESLLLEGRHAIRPLLRSPAGLARLARFALDDWRITDALDPDRLERDLEGCDVLVHGIVGDYDRIPAAARAAAQATARRKIRLVYLSTASVHGQDPPPGTDESSPITDRQPLPYNAAKVRAERAIAEVPGADVCVLRPSIVFGPRSQWTIGLARDLAHGVAYLVEGGHGVCNSIYVDNLVHAIRIAFDHPRAGTGPFYVADAEARSWREFYRPLVEGLGRSMDEVWTVPAVGPPPPTWQQRLGRLRRVGLARRAIGVVPRRLKDAAIAGLARYAAGPPPGEFALPQAGPPGATFEMSELHRCRTRLPMDRAVATLGYQPVVPLEEGLRRSALFLQEAALFEGSRPRP